jgi:hypothetical protein
VVLLVTSRLRIRVATGLLFFVLLWPPVQHVAARTIELDPWAFFGFAMYAVPNMRVTVRAARIESPAAGRSDAELAPDWNALSPASYKALRAFAERRARWGKLLAPDVLARELFDLQPDLPGLVIRVRRWAIDHESARLEPRDNDYRYAPPGERIIR